MKRFNCPSIPAYPFPEDFSHKTVFDDKAFFKEVKRHLPRVSRVRANACKIDKLLYREYSKQVLKIKRGRAMKANGATQVTSIKEKTNTVVAARRWWWQL